MTPAFPDSRTLAGWWRHLAPWQPQELWVGHLLLHHVEALVRVVRRARLAEFDRHLLDAVALGPQPVPTPAPNGVAPGVSLSDLTAVLHLEAALVRESLLPLERQGLIARGPAPRAEAWHLTPLGRQARERAVYPSMTSERRSFHFVQAAADQPACFLSLACLGGRPCPAPAGWTFDPEHLRAAVCRPPEWKERHGFPTEVMDVLSFGPEGSVDPAVATWDAVILAHAEHPALALVRTAGSATQQPRFLGFSASPEGWGLAASPCLTLGEEAAREALRGLLAEPPAEAWRQAWLAWARSRNVPAADAEACQLERAGACLSVRCKQLLPAIRGEVWLLAGDGPVRAAARVAINERAA